jgi:pimeloyl-ACP methyl ester carboxylesterase
MAPLDMVYIMGWVSNLDSFWEGPLYARFLQRLASFSRLILFDKRGAGLSEGGPMAALFAATYPDRTLGLIMYGSYAKRVWDPEYPWALK